MRRSTEQRGRETAMRKSGRRKRFIAILVLLVGMAFGLGACDKPPPPPVVQQTKPVAKKAAETPSPKKVTTSQEKPAFTYNPRGLVDPFKPFIQIGSTSKSVDGIPKTPLQEYDLSQLKLTAIIWVDDKESCAMVEDSAGKGFTLKRGTYIGKRGGKVKAIRKDRVIVELPLRTYGTKSDAQEVVMKMPEEGGKK
jgi:Tfp pilus assembly protein PilP